MSSDLTVGRTEFRPYDGLDTDEYLSAIASRCVRTKKQADDIMADVIMTSDNDGVINGVIINGMDLSNVCSKAEIHVECGLTETVLHINTKSVRILQAEEKTDYKF